MSKSKKAAVVVSEVPAAEVQAAAEKIPVIRKAKDFCLKCSEEHNPGQEYKDIPREKREVRVWAATFTDLSLATPIWKCTECGREYPRKMQTPK
jgi:hypothetical protein